jgi:(R,R)-butanediol dehydrogenase/meso-butanediol dehydrogenase/diacetyl reductase
MKVPVLVSLAKIEFQDRPKPEIQSGDVLVQVEYCGICGTDIHAYLNGIPFPLGTVMGHECSGVVAEVGDGVKDFQPGERIVVRPGPCGKCYWCQRGQYSLCPQGLERAISTQKHDGAFAEYVKIEYPDEMLIKFPSSISFKEAALIEPLSTTLHGVRSSRFKAGDCVVVIGAGMIGLGIIQFLRLGGAGKIIVLEISSQKTEIARKLGADVVLNPLSEEEGLKEKIFDITNGIGADIVFECVGLTSTLQTSINYVKRGGQVMVIGINLKAVPIDALTIVVKEVNMKGVFGFYDEFKYVIEFLDKKRINTDLLISDIIPLSDIEEKGFKQMLASNEKVKILVRP